MERERCEGSWAKDGGVRVVDRVRVDRIKKVMEDHGGEGDLLICKFIFRRLQPPSCERNFKPARIPCKQIFNLF